jgi:hypothetical protein
MHAVMAAHRDTSRSATGVLRTALLVLRTALLVLCALLVPAAALAQCPPPVLPPDVAPPCELNYPSWTGELAVLGGNALLGGLSAGVIHRLRGGDFSEAFVRGLAGGAVVYGGKRIAVERFGGAGLVGRQVAAVGASMTRNAADGLAPAERLMLPVGPLWVQLQGERPRVSARVDLVSTGWLISGILDRDLRFDAGMSLSAGAHVFVADGRVIVPDRRHEEGDDQLHPHAHGITMPGFMALAGVPAFGRHVARQVFQHERVHVLQMDQLHIGVTGPIEARLIPALPVVGRYGRYFDINLSGALLGVLAGPFGEHLRRPWETEAIFLSR